MECHVIELGAVSTIVLPETEAAKFLSFFVLFFRAKFLSYEYSIGIKLWGNFAISNFYIFSV